MTEREGHSHAGPDFAPRHEAHEFGSSCYSGAQPEVGLALSGGGLRATLFHLGSLARLRELGWLARLDQVSSVSGGSIMAAVLARAWSTLEREDFSSQAFDQHVTQPTLAVARQRIDVPTIARGLIPGVNPADVLARTFDGVLTHGMSLRDLPDRPRFVFNAAHVATGVSWRFAKAYMGDPRLGVVCDPNVALSRVVAASAAFPPFVAPLVLDLRGVDLQETDGADLFSDPRFRDLHDRVLLIGGGAIDNLGIETIEGSCKIVLALAGGGSLKVDAGRNRYRFWWPLVRRTLDISIEVGRVQRRRALIDRATAARSLPSGSELRQEMRTERVALWRTTYDVSTHPLLPDGWTVAPGWNDYLASRPTRLWPMPEPDRQRLVNWGYLISDLVLRRYVPELETAEPPEDLPFPALDFARPPSG
ncbi:MAG: patatin-like phospholipase family protein [Chloroflexota bacterium]